MPYSTQPAVRIAILDEQAIVRFGVCSRLAAEIDLSVVGNYADAGSLLTGLAAHPADLLLLDDRLALSEYEGTPLIASLRARFPTTRLLLFATHEDFASGVDVIRMGVCGLIDKKRAVNDIVDAIHVVANGGAFLNTEPPFRLAEHHSNIASSAAPNTSQIDRAIAAIDAATDLDRIQGEPELAQHNALSPREREVIRCFLDGMSVTQIAQKFERSVKTISTQKTTAFRKLGVATDNGLFRLRYRLSDL